MGDPTIVFVKSEGPRRLLQKPKSATFIIPSLSRILEGLRSRWRMFSLTREENALRIWEKI